MLGKQLLTRRELIRASILTATGAALAACGATPAPTSTSAPPAEATSAPAAEPTATAAPAATAGEKVAIRWQDFPDFEPFWPRIQEALAQALPNISVEFQPMNYDAWGEKLLAAMTAGVAPDVFCSWEPESGKFAEKRTVLDLEHESCYTRTSGWNALTDGRLKYIYHAFTGEQQLFDLQADPGELRDLASEPEHQATLREWRRRLVEHLAERGALFVAHGDLALRTKPMYHGANYPKRVSGP